MKIRSGFVSNSSTSSFFLYGAWLDRGTANVKASEYLKIPVAADRDAVYETLDKLCRAIPDAGLIYHVTDFNEVIIGVSPYRIPDDARMGEWKSSVLKTLQDIFGPDVKADWQSGEYAS